jgi:hypothetical protein
MTDNLRELINTIQLIDQHAHPGFAGYFEDFPPENRVLIAFDPYLNPEDSSTGFPYLRDVHYEAYRKIYGFSREAINNPLQKEDLASEYDRQRNNLKHLIDRTLDAAGVEFLIANSFLHNDLKSKSRVKFIPVIDPLLFPFDNTYLTDRSPLTCSYIAAFEHMLNIMKVKNNFSSQSFAEYLGFVDRVIAKFVNNGAVGLKFYTGYIRSTYFEKVEEIEGSLLFERAKRGVSAAYKRLQDLLVWHIMRKSVEYDLPVQWHCSLLDSHIDYADCLNLAEMLRDPIVSKAKIVVLHGNYPRFDRAETMALSGAIITNNVYLDISGTMMLNNHPKILAGTLRKWLEKPALWDKIMYGSNACRGERYIYVGSKVGRDAVYFALKSMIDDTIIDEKTATTIARKILRENAQRLYKL